MINEIFETLGFKEEEAKTYLSLMDVGTSSAGELSKVMGIKRPTVYGYLERLVAAGLVGQSIRRGVKVFMPESGEKIRALYKAKMDDLRSKEKVLDVLLPELEKKAGMSLFRPRMQFYEGQDGIQTLMQDVWQYSDLKTYTMWPILSMRDVITPDFLHYHNVMRIRKNIWIDAIWQRDQTLELAKNTPPDLGSSAEHLREIRLAPEGMKFKMGYWIYANKVAFVSSRAESFGFLIESTELIEVLMAQHKVIWSVAETIDMRSRAEKQFFEEVYNED